MKKISKKKINTIKKLRKEGLSHRQIAYRLNISVGSAFSYSREIKLVPKQHLYLKQLNYKRSLGKISNEKRAEFSKKGGIITQLKYVSPYSKRKIIKLIRDFFLEYKRIPFKKEFLHEKVARQLFGSWNKAIIATGFRPNPEKFAHKHIANDGHKCDSLAEKIIDDWLFEKKISHETKVPYNHNRMTADFKIGDTYVEFFGLQGQVKKYDMLVVAKEKLWKKKRLSVIKIYPSDLYPKNRLNQIFGRYYEKDQKTLVE